MADCQTGGKKADPSCFPFTGHNLQSKAAVRREGERSRGLAGLQGQVRREGLRGLAGLQGLVGLQGRRAAGLVFLVGRQGCRAGGADGALPGECQTRSPPPGWRPGEGFSRPAASWLEAPRGKCLRAGPAPAPSLSTGPAPTLRWPALGSRPEVASPAASPHAGTRRRSWAACSQAGPVLRPRRLGSGVCSPGLETGPGSPPRPPPVPPSVSRLKTLLPSKPHF